MNPSVPKIFTLIACLIFAGLSADEARADAVGSGYGSGSSLPTNDAVCTRLYGHVRKAELDEKKQAMLLPKECKTGDRLPEGTLVETGIRSGAELKWSYVITRIYERSLVRIQPNMRQVFLQQGTLLFRLQKNRPDTDIYLLETKLLQARIHGTTVKVYSDDSLSKISVTEGQVEVTSKVDGNTVNLGPGTNYEVKAIGRIRKIKGDLIESPSDSSQTR